MSAVEKKWSDFDLDSDSNISAKLQKAEEDDKGSFGCLQMASLDRFCSSSSQKRLNPERERHAELFRKDLISAMKLADSEMLQPEEYFQITDPWKQEWERGVQVPINPGAIIPNVVRVISETENSNGSPTFKLPKKFLHAAQDEAFKPAFHELHEGQKLTEEVCRYDLDDLDISWLQAFNEICEEMGKDPVTELQVERVIEELETHCHTKLHQAQKTVEGLGIEYDENVVCDVCRSPEGEDNNEMVFCDSCDVCIHQACYGIQMIPEGNWLCRACALGIKPQCLLCPNPGGAMKSTKNGSDWAHISCALWIPEVHIGCPERMEPINNITTIPASRWSLVCTLCRERQGACIQCSVKSCKTSFHVTCAFQNNLEMHQTYDETVEDVQMKAFCPKHSGQKTSDNVNEDGMPLSPKPQSKSEFLTEEEKTERRSHRLKKLEEEFYLYVSPKEVAEVVGIDEAIIDFIYNYWVIKRKSQFNRPLLMPKLEEGDILLKQREDGLLARLKMFINLRQELERVRNLCYMVCKREKLNRQMYRSKEEIWQLAKTIGESDSEVDASLPNVLHATNTIYDHPDGILRAARLLVQREHVLDMQESQSMPAEKIADGDTVKQQTETDVESTPSLHPARLEFAYEKDEFCAADNKTGIKKLSGVTAELFSRSLKLSDGKSRNVDADEFGIMKWGKSNFIDIDETNKSLDGFSSEEENKPLAELLVDSPKEVKRNNRMTPNRLSMSSLTSTSDITKELEKNQPIELREIDSKLDNAGDVNHLNTNLNLSAVDKFSEVNAHNPGRQIPESCRDIDNVLKEAGALNGESSASANKSLNHRGHDNKSDSQAIEYVTCNSTNQPLENTNPTLTSVKSTKRSEAIQTKAKKPGVISRRSKRYSKVADENLEKTDSAVVSCLGTVFADQRTADESVNKSVTEPEATDHANKVNFVHEPLSQSLSNESGQNTGVSKEDDENGWSSIKHKLPLNNKPSCLTDILKRFTPGQLVVSKEIKERVERCLLNLPYLKSSNGKLCKHLQQKLTACNLNYAKQAVQPLKRHDKNLNDNQEQSASSAVNQITSSVDNSTDCTWHSLKIKKNLPKVKDDGEFKLESDELEDLNFGKMKRQKLCRRRRRSRFREFKYDDVDASDSFNDVEFVLSDSSSSECSQSSACDSYGSERNTFADGGSSNSIVKGLWHSKFKR